MGQALYRKYRSKKLSEIVGQEHITRTLERALKTGKISHAYLFTGPRGVGKTSIARILAHEINQLPYTDESMHLDIIEIDAASNRRIDEIRDLREKVHIAPTSAKYKVYIIDEVHMLTKEAFNALLKTLEEPPAHVIFILATTELHKLPETIVSRTQRFTFKAIDESQAVQHLKTIAETEGMQIDDDALRLLAAQGHGSFRDSISLLDQVGNSGKKISRSDAEKLVGVAASDHITGLLEATRTGTAADVLAAMDRLLADGVHPGQAAKQLAAEVRQLVMANQADAADLDLLKDLLDVSASTDPAARLEVALFSANLKTNPSSLAVRTVATEKPPIDAVSRPNVEQQPAAAPQPKAKESTKVDTPKVPATGNSADWWEEVLTHIKQVNNTLYGVLRMAETTIDGDTLHLRFGFGFHKKKIDDGPTQTKLRAAIKAVTGKAYKIETTHDAAMTGQPKRQGSIAVAIPPVATSEPTNPELSSITDIFGGAEVLES